MMYQLTTEGYVLRSDGTRISTWDTSEQPNTNPDYLAYLSWLAAGGIPLPAKPEEKVVPSSISPAQGRLVLLDMGLIPTLQNHIESLEEPEKSKAVIAFYATTEWRRDSPFLCEVATALNLSSEQLDNLFITASEIII